MDGLAIGKGRHRCNPFDLCEASRQLEFPLNSWLKSLDAGDGAHIKGSIYVRIELTVPGILVSDTRDHHFRIDHKQNKTALAQK